MQRFKNRAGAPIPQGMARAAHRLVAVGIAAACAQALAGCGSQDPATDGSGAVLQVSERDFKISAPKVVRAGDVRLVVTNRGPDDHELIVVHAPVVGSLPMRADGVTVDEALTEHVRTGGIEPAPGGTVSHLRLHLRPGRYLLLCNMSGHYLGGMKTAVTVR